jgi:hypothetical protein
MVKLYLTLFVRGMAKITANDPSHSDGWRNYKNRVAPSLVKAG